MSFILVLIVHMASFRAHMPATDRRGDESLPPQGEAVVISFLRLAQMRKPQGYKIEGVICDEVRFELDRYAHPPDLLFSRLKLTLQK